MGSCWVGSAVSSTGLLGNLGRCRMSAGGDLQPRPLRLAVDGRGPAGRGVSSFELRSSAVQTARSILLVYLSRERAPSAAGGTGESETLRLPRAFAILTVIAAGLLKSSASVQLRSKNLGLWCPENWNRLYPNASRRARSFNGPCSVRPCSR